jgi:hypothetical protein
MIAQAESRTAESREALSALEQGHVLRRSIVEDVAAFVAQGTFSCASRRFGEYRLQQERHLVVEEALFGLLRQAGAARAELTRLQAHHAFVRQRIHRMDEALCRCDPAGFQRAHHGLVQALGCHEVFEGALLLPDVRRAVRTDTAFVQQVARLAEGA